MSDRREFLKTAMGAFIPATALGAAVIESGVIFREGSPVKRKFPPNPHPDDQYRESSREETSRLFKETGVVSTATGESSALLNSIYYYDHLSSVVRDALDNLRSIVKHETLADDDKKTELLKYIHSEKLENSFQSLGIDITKDPTKKRGDLVRALALGGTALALPFGMPFVSGLPPYHDNTFEASFDGGAASGFMYGIGFIGGKMAEKSVRRDILSHHMSQAFNDLRQILISGDENSSNRIQAFKNHLEQGRLPSIVKFLDSIAPNDPQTS